MSKKKWWNMFVEFEDGGEGSPAPAAGDEEIDPADIDALLARTRELTADLPPAEEEPAPPPHPEPPPQAPASMASPVAATSSIVEGRPLDEIYDEQGCVPPSPKTVEEIVMFLDGLKAMPMAVQQQALDAMDNADADWTVDDVVLDARNKIEALRRAQAGLGDTMQLAQRDAQADIDARDELIQRATETIDTEIAAHKQQIAELESLREQEVAGAEEAKKAAREALTNTQQACGREAERLDVEIGRLELFIRTFGPQS